MKAAHSSAKDRAGAVTVPPPHPANRTSALVRNIDALNERQRAREGNASRKEKTAKAVLDAIDTEHR